MGFKFKKFSSSAVVPFLATSGSGCFDLCSVDNYLIEPNSVKVINTDVGIAIPNGFLGKIFTRSSWALKFKSVEGCVIDSDYRGKIKVICHNNVSVAQICFFKSDSQLY